MKGSAASSRLSTATCLVGVDVSMAALLLSTALALTVSAVSPIAWLPVLRRLGAVDVPSARSSHSVTTARGVGLAPASGLLAAGSAAALLGVGSSEVVSLLATGLVVAGLGLWEDVSGVPVLTRLLIQLVLGVLAGGVLLAMAGVSNWWVPVVALAFVSYVNAANFMDGIDGISAAHGLLCGAYFAFLGSQTGSTTLLLGGSVLAASYLAFLPWNLGRSRVFLGDCGSYLLGAAVLLLAVVAVLHRLPFLVAVAPLLPYLSDTGWTLVCRSLRHEALWEPHRTHVYQRLLRRGFRHLSVTGFVAVATVACALLAWTYRGELAAWIGCILVIATYLASPTLLAQRGTKAVA